MIGRGGKRKRKREEERRSGKLTRRERKDERTKVEAKCVSGRRERRGMDK